MHAPFDAELPLHACSNLKRMTELPSVQLLHSPSNAVPYAVIDLPCAVPLCCLQTYFVCGAFMLGQFLSSFTHTGQ